MKLIDQMIVQFHIAKREFENASSIDFDADIMNQIAKAQYAYGGSFIGTFFINEIIKAATNNEDKDLPLINEIADSIRLAANAIARITSAVYTIKSYNIAKRDRRPEEDDLAASSNIDIAVARDAIQTTRNSMAEIEAEINRYQASVNATVAPAASSSSTLAWASIAASSSAPATSSDRASSSSSAATSSAAPATSSTLVWASAPASSAATTSSAAPASCSAAAPDARSSRKRPRPE